MLKELKELNETYKYKMFRALAWTLGTFVTLFTTLTIAMLAAEGSQTQSWEWKFEWVNVVSWEVRKPTCAYVDAHRSVGQPINRPGTRFEFSHATTAVSCFFIASGKSCWRQW